MKTKLNLEKPEQVKFIFYHIKLNATVFVEKKIMNCTFEIFSFIHFPLKSKNGNVLKKLENFRKDAFLRDLMEIREYIFSKKFN